MKTNLKHLFAPITVQFQHNFSLSASLYCSDEKNRFMWWAENKEGSWEMVVGGDKERELTGGGRWWRSERVQMMLRRWKGREMRRESWMEVEDGWKKGNQQQEKKRKKETKMDGVKMKVGVVGRIGGKNRMRQKLCGVNRERRRGQIVSNKTNGEKWLSDGWFVGDMPQSESKSDWLRSLIMSMMFSSRNFRRTRAVQHTKTKTKLKCEKQ